MIQSMSCDQFCTCANSRAHRIFKFVAACSSNGLVGHMFVCANFSKVIFHLTHVTAGSSCACAQSWLQLILCYLWLFYRQKKTRFLSNIQDFSSSYSILKPILNAIFVLIQAKHYHSMKFHIYPMLSESTLVYLFPTRHY